MANTKFSTSSINQGLVKSRSMLVGNAAFSLAAFESIATATADGSSSVITLSSIPQTYEYLQLRLFLKSSDANPMVRIRMNNDANAKYSLARMAGFEGIFGQSYDAYTYDSFNDSQTNYHAANTSSPNLIGTRVAIIDVYDYANTSKFTSVRSLYGAHGDPASTPGSVGINHFQYGSTTAITSITFTTGNAVAWDSNSYVALYGIKGA